MRPFRSIIFVISLAACLVRGADGQIVEKQWQSLAAFPDEIYVVYFLGLPGPPRIGFAGGHGMVYRTSDGGETWNTTIADNYNFRALDFVFKDSLTGWFANWLELSDSLQCFKTTDGGQTWKAMYAPVFNATSLFYDQPDKRLFISGWGLIPEDGTLSSSTDDGTTWTIQSDQNDFNGLAFSNSDTGVITHEYSISDYRTMDGGQTWTKIDSDANETFQPLADTFRNVYWAASEKGPGYPPNHISLLFESINDGESFKAVDTIPSITGTIREGSCGMLYLQSTIFNPDSLKGILQSKDGMNWTPLRDSHGNSGPFNKVDTRFFVAGTYIFAADSFHVWRYVGDSTKYGGTVFSAPQASAKHFNMIASGCNNLDSTIYIDYQNDCIPASIDSVRLGDSSRFAIHLSSPLPHQVSGYDSIIIEHIPVSRTPDSTLLYLQYSANGASLYDTVYVTASIVGGNIIAPFDILANGTKNAEVGGGDTVDFRILLTDSLAQSGWDSIRFQSSFDGDVLSFSSARAVNPWTLLNESHSEGTESITVSHSKTQPASANSPIADIFYTANVSGNSSMNYVLTGLSLNGVEFDGCVGPASLPVPPVVTVSGCGDTLLRQVMEGKPIIQLLGIEMKDGIPTISFRCAESGLVEITISDLLGRQLRTMDADVVAGTDESVSLPVDGISEGLYFVSISSNSNERVSTRLLIGER